MAFGLRKKALHSLAVVLLLGIGVFGASIFVKGDLFKERLDELKEERASRMQAIQLRAAIWRTAHGLWKDNYLWGVGPGLFEQTFRPYRDRGLQSNPGHVHKEDTCYIYAL